MVVVAVDLLPQSVMSLVLSTARGAPFSGYVLVDMAQEICTSN